MPNESAIPAKPHINWVCLEPIAPHRRDYRLKRFFLLVVWYRGSPRYRPTNGTAWFQPLLINGVYDDCGSWDVRHIRNYGTAELDAQSLSKSSFSGRPLVFPQHFGVARRNIVCAEDSSRGGRGREGFGGEAKGLDRIRPVVGGEAGLDLELTDEVGGLGQGYRAEAKTLRESVDETATRPEARF